MRFVFDFCCYHSDKVPVEPLLLPGWIVQVWSNHFTGFRFFIMKLYLVPQIFVWGSCLWFCIPAPPPPPRLLLLLRRLLFVPHLQTSTCVLRGRPGTWWHPPSFCVAGVALRAGLALVARLDRISRRWRRVTLRGRRGTWWRVSSFHVANMALSDIYLRFTWQAWHLVTSTFVLHGKPGTWRHPPSFCVAGVVLKALGWLWWRVAKCHACHAKCRGVTGDY